MIDQFEAFLGDNPEPVFLLLRHYLKLDKPLLLRSDLWDAFEDFCASDDGQPLCGSPVSKVISATQEAAVDGDQIFLAVRPWVARWSYLRFDVGDMEYSSVPVSDFLRFKERLVGSERRAADWVLKVDFGPFSREFPKLREARSIGRGVEFLNRTLSGKFFAHQERGAEQLLQFLRVHQCQGQQLMLNERIKDVHQLRGALRDALRN